MNRPAFRRALLAWYDRSRRDLPWRESDDFYRVWISEVMLQQTRVEAVVGYYRRFLERFPSIASLAAAPADAVLGLWSGLGYYSRARNLHRAARELARAGLPETYEQVLALPGAGPYTAAAIASIALGLPHAAVDGNVMRVISRLENDGSDLGSAAARRQFGDRAGLLLDRRRPGDFNQAMMELGATVCLPRAPACGACPVSKFCAARAAGTERQLPVKLKKQVTRAVSLDLALIRKDPGARVFLVQRPHSEKRLAGFWELPAKADLKHPPGLVWRRLGEFRHQIVGDRFRVAVWGARARADLPMGGKWLGPREYAKVPLTTVARKALAFALRNRGT